MQPVTPIQRSRARSLRREMTGPEKRLWARLRAHRLLGVHFRRQVPMDGFIVDFASHARHLVIELDGDQHGAERAIARDATRDARLRLAGYRVLRFSNWQVMNEFESVLRTIEAHLVSDTPSPSSPGAGEGDQWPAP